MSETTPVPPVIDFESLLAPIDGDNSAGESLRYEGTYDQIKESRREDEVLTQGDWARDLKVAEWPKVIQLATTALTKKTKDLQIAAWLVEGITKNDRLNRWAGLRDGLHLVRALQEQYWDNLYPEIDPDDDEGPFTARANVLAALDERLGVIVFELPLTAGAKYNYLQYQEAKQFDIPENLAALEYDQQEKYTALRTQAEAERKVTGDDWRKAKAASSFEFISSQSELINECWDQMQALDAVMDEKYARATPGLNALKKSLNEIRTLIDILIKEKRPAAEVGVEEADGSDAVSESSLAGGTGGGGISFAVGNIRSRQEALRQIEKIADFFRQTEPHSPISFLLLRAVKWGNMPFESVWADLIKEGAALETMRETLGFNTQNSTE
ncbi:MAG: type VI secretion system protein TssA [Acidobacteria bacterium]|nr:type VI secretion system protein TssA [Acidobacteriota bacterium]